MSDGRTGSARPVSRGPGRRAAVCGALLLALGLSASRAAARERVTFVHRVELATGAVTKVSELSVARSDRVPRARPPRGWWRTTTRNDRLALDVFVDEEVDVREADPTRAITARALVVSAGGIARLRLPSPAPQGAIVWSVLEGDGLVLEWQSGSGERLRLGIDLARGAVGWRRPLPPGLATHARAAGAGRVFVYTTRALEVVEASTGATVWKQPRAAGDQTDDIESCGFEASRWVIRSSAVTTLDPASGAVRWRASLGPGLPRWCLVHGDQVFVSWRTGIGSVHERDLLVALDASDGRVLWRTPAAAPFTRGGVLGDGALIIWSTDGVARLDPTTGHALWTLRGARSLDIEVLADGDWFLPDDCMRVDARTGAERWHLDGAGRCLRQGESAIYTASVARAGLGRATVMLRRYSFDRQRLVRESVVHRYARFFDNASADVIEIGPAAAIVASDFIVLE